MNKDVQMECQTNKQINGQRKFVIIINIIIIIIIIIIKNKRL